MKTNIVVEYVENIQGESQYGVCDFEDSKVVDARYVKSRIPNYVGNPFIECLPDSVIDDKRIFEKGLIGYNYPSVKAMDKEDRAIYLFAIRDLRFIMPFHKEIFRRFKAALIDSYSKRTLEFFRGKPKIIHVENGEVGVNCVTGSSASEGVSGVFSLCGKSGTGKSSGMHMVLAQFPQLIKHKLDNGGYFYQLVYIFVQCSPNSNFQGLFKSICVAIDQALGNHEPVYGAAIDKIRSGVSAKREYVRSLIETFGIGAIIVDECQLMDFDHIKESTYDSLMVLTNETKVAIIPVGTQEARDKMFREFKNARRIGSPVNSDICCNDRLIFNINMCKLFKYQFTDIFTKVKGPVKTSHGLEFEEETLDLANAFYSMSKGVIAQMVSVYMMCQYEAVTNSRKTPITAKFVCQVAKKYFPGIIPLLENMELEENIVQFEKERDSVIERENVLLDQLRQQKNSDEIVESYEKDDFLLNMFERIAGHIMLVTSEHTESEIKRVFYKIVKDRNVAESDERKLVKEVFSVLNNEKVKAKSKQLADLKNCSAEALRKFVGVDK